MKDTAIALGKLLEEHKGGDVSVLDMTGLNSWTDYFVIATVTSFVHARGLYKVVREYAEEHELDVHFGRQRRQDDEDQWLLIDLGNIVIHFMTAQARSFYNLENLWYGAAVLYSGGSGIAAE